MSNRLTDSSSPSQPRRRTTLSGRLLEPLRRSVDHPWIAGILMAILLLTVAIAGPQDRIPSAASDVRVHAIGRPSTEAPTPPFPVERPMTPDTENWDRAQPLAEWLAISSGSADDSVAPEAPMPATESASTSEATNTCRLEVPLELFDESVPTRETAPDWPAAGTAEIVTFVANDGTESTVEPQAPPAEATADGHLPPMEQAQALPEFPMRPAWSSCNPCGRPFKGLHCNGDVPCRDLKWKDAWLLPWEVFAQGDYIGPARLPHVPEYRLRVDDRIEFVYRITGDASTEPYRINVGDQLQIESLTDETLNRTVLVQRDGRITLSQVGEINIAGRTIDEVRQELDEKYSQYIQNPSITVSPVQVNRTLEELRATVDSRFGSGGQSRTARVTPEGTVQLPAIGSVPAHGLTLEELGREINLRYAAIVDGIEVTAILQERAPRYIYVLGEVRTPGRYSLEGPTTLMQSIALAGGWNVGADTRHVIVFRRDQNWCLMAAQVNLKKTLYGGDPCPESEMWLQDSDIVLVPKSGLLVANEVIELVFTRGIYGVVPFNTSVNFVKSLSTVGPAVVPVP